MPKGIKRKHSRKGLSSYRKKGGYKRSKFGYGPVGGVRPGRFGTVSVAIPSPINTPDRIFVKTSWTYVGAFPTGAAGAFAKQTLHLNSYFNPGGTLASGQPTGATQWLGTNSLFQSYIVHACRITMTVTNSNLASGTANNAIVGFYPRANSARAAVSSNEASGLTRARSGFVIAYAPKVLSAYYTIGQIAGVTPQVVAIADSFAAPYSADPTSLIVCDLWAADSQLTTAFTLAVKVTVEQYLECFNRQINP